MLLALLLVLHFAIAMVVVYGLDWLALIPWRRAQGAHWTVRARLLWPIRRTNALLFFVVPIVLGGTQYSFFPEIPQAYLPAAVTGFAGAILGMWPMARTIFPDLEWREWLRNLAALFVIRLLTLGAMIVAGFWMPYHLGWTAAGITALVVVANLSVMWGGGLWLLRRMGALVAAPARLTEIVRDIATRMNLPMPGVWMLRAYGANAIAFPVLNQLAVTERALAILPDDELGAVCAHEFGHLSEPPSVVATLALSAFVLLPAIYLKPAVHAWGPGGYFAIGGLLMILPRLVRAFRRSMEKRADSAAKTHEGESPGTYARALERLYEANQVPAVTPNNLSHPSLYDRLLAAGVTPAYPRPKEPPQFTWPTAVVLGLLFISIPPVMDRWERDSRAKKAEARARAHAAQFQFPLDHMD